MTTNGAIRLLIPALLVLALPVLALPEEKDELQAAEEKIHAMLRKAEELQAAGRFDEAAKVQAKAEQLLRKLEAKAGKRRPKPEAKRDERREILHGLEQGIEALRKLGRGKEAEHLERIADEVRGKVRSRGTAPPHGNHEHENEEIRIARKRIKIMRYAVEAWIAAGRQKAADSMEHALHALELAVEGKHSTEAMHIRKTAPDLAQQVELLMGAAEILGKRGQGEKAHAVAGLAKELRQIWERRRKGPERPRERPEELRALQKRVERLEAQIEALTLVLEQLRGQQQERRRPR